MFWNVKQRLSKVTDPPPDDLVDFYEHGDLPQRADLRINVLPLAEAVKISLGMRGVGLFGSMGLLILDDANDSNPFCYITKGPARGGILHLCHDGVTAVEYASLSTWLAALRSAMIAGADIDELKGKQEFHPEFDQAVLSAHASALAVEDSEAAETELPILAKLIDTKNSALVAALAAHPYCYVREAAAELIQARPTSALRDVAKRLSQDRVPQVAGSGKAAQLAVRRHITER